MDRLAVYLDLVVFLNFLVDFLLLLGTNCLAGFPARYGRCAVGALLGSLYSGWCLMPGFRFLGGLHWRIVCLGILGAAAFGWDRSGLRRTGIFVLLSMALGGLAVSLGRRDFLALAAAAGLCWGLCRVSFGKGIIGREYVPVVLKLGEKRVSIIALKDTGNTLRDPISGEAVLVVSAEVGQRLLGLTMEELKHPLETLAKGRLPGLRLIPYQAVGITGGMLLGIRMQEVTVGDRTGSAVVAFAPEGLGRNEGYQALTGGMV